MLERLLTRQRLVLGAQILAGVAAAFTLDSAFAQSPAAMGVYRSASTFNAGGLAAGQSQSTQGINAFGAGNASAGMGGLADMSSMAGGMEGTNIPVVKTKDWESIQVDEPEYVYRGHEENKPITSLQFFPVQDGEELFVLSASADKTARIWLLEGKYDPETAEWFVTNGRLRKNYKDEHRQGVTSATISPDSKYILTCSYDQIGRLWSLNNQENIRAYLGAKDRLWSIKVDNAGQYVACACNDGRIYFWDSLTVKKLGSLPNREDASKLGAGFEDAGHEGPVFDIAFSPDSNFVASAGADGTIRMWNISLQRQVSVIKASDDKIYSLCFSEDGSLLLAAGRDKTARLFNATTGEEVCRFVGHTGAVHRAIFAGDYIATASDDGTARLWTTQSKDGSSNVSTTVGQSTGFGSPSGIPGSGMSGANSGYPGAQGEQKTAGKPSRKPGKAKGTELACFNVNSPVASVAVSADNVYLVTGSYDGAASVWRVPGNARYYGSSNSNTGSGYNSTNPVMGTGFGSSPLADPSKTM